MVEIPDTEATPVTETQIMTDWRQECKYTLTKPQALMIERRLRPFLTMDKHGDENGYWIHSLYFDTPFDQFYKEKLQGYLIRQKFRLRYYGEKPDFIRLENKRKHGPHGQKRSIILSKAEANDLLNGDIHFLSEKKEPLAKAFLMAWNSGMRPKVIVSYQRKAFVYPYGNVRITLDSNIQTSHDISCFLDEFKHFSIEDHVIMEVKYDGYFPDFLADLLNIINPHRQAYSKYAMSRYYE